MEDLSAFSAKQPPLDNFSKIRDTRQVWKWPIRFASSGGVRDDCKPRRLDPPIHIASSLLSNAGTSVRVVPLDRV
jgi:hypothetical protein